MSVIGRAGHPLSSRPRIDFEDLRKSTWVLSRHGSPSREFLKRFFCEARQQPPVPAVETGDLLFYAACPESDLLTAFSAHQFATRFATAAW